MYYNSELMEIIFTLNSVLFQIKDDSLWLGSKTTALLGNSMSDWRWNYSLTHKGIDFNCQQDTFKRSDLGVTECSALCQNRNWYKNYGEMKWTGSLELYQLGGAHTF